jgi:hypothetical protein
LQQKAKYRNVGMMEYWNGGVVAKTVTSLKTEALEGLSLIRKSASRFSPVGVIRDF